MAHLEVKPKPKRPMWMWALLVIILILLGFTIFKYSTKGPEPTADHTTDTLETNVNP